MMTSTFFCFYFPNFHLFMYMKTNPLRLTWTRKPCSNDGRLLVSLLLKASVERELVEKEVWRSGAVLEFTILDWRFVNLGFSFMNFFTDGLEICRRGGRGGGLSTGTAGVFSAILLTDLSFTFQDAFAIFTFSHLQIYQVKCYINKPIKQSTMNRTKCCHLWTI